MRYLLAIQPLGLILIYLKLKCVSIHNHSPSASKFSVEFKCVSRNSLPLICSVDVVVDCATVIQSRIYFACNSHDPNGFTGRQPLNEWKRCTQCLLLLHCLDGWNEINANTSDSSNPVVGLINSIDLSSSHSLLVLTCFRFHSHCFISFISIQRFSRKLNFSPSSTVTKYFSFTLKIERQLKEDLFRLVSLRQLKYTQFTRKMSAFAKAILKAKMANSNNDAKVNAPNQKEPLERILTVNIKTMRIHMHNDNFNNINTLLEVFGEFLW